MKILKHLVFCGIALALAGCASNPPVNGTPAEREHVATLALLCADVLDLRRVQQRQENPAAEPVPPKWSRFAPKEEGGTWEIVGYVTASDEMAFMGHLPVFRPNRVLHGVLAREIANPDRYVVVIRGTRWTVEWLKDGETAFDTTSWGYGVLAHHGFYGVYQSMRYQPKGGKQEDKPAWRSILDATQGKPLTVVGHSLGAPVAAFLTLDIASERKDIAGRYFASPRPGNLDLAREVAKRIDNYVVYNNPRDIVPGMPPSAFGTPYQPLDRIDRLEPYNDKLRIDGDVLCQHNAISYAALLQPLIMTVDQWQERLAQSKYPRNCIAANVEPN